MFRRTIVAATVLLSPVLAFAAPIPGKAINISDVKGLVESIATTLLTLAAITVVIFIVYGGILIVMSPTDPGNVKKGKDVIKNAIIGGLVIFGVGVIVNTIANFASDPTTINRGGPPVKYAREGVSS